ncbi:MAG TPA: metal-dependent hydrolase [Thermoanaerobaculia bacterium]
MPTIITHPFTALLKTWWPSVPKRAVPAGVVMTVLPDADVVAFMFGIPYQHMLGHRGITHSIAFAVLVALLGTAMLRVPAHRRTTFTFLFICAISHPLLDALTNGGLGVALFAPFHNERYFFPWTPIRVSPIGAAFFTPRGFATLISEMQWVWLPAAILALAGRHLRHARSGAAGS